MSKLFWVDQSKQITYNEFVKDLKKEEKISYFIQSNDSYLVFLYLIKNLLNGKRSVLLDQDFSLDELNSLGASQEQISESFYLSSLRGLRGIVDVLCLLDEHGGAVQIFTSGTTGRPKSVEQNFRNLTRSVKKSAEYSANIWGFAYNPTHFAGLQVFFQAFLNQNTLVYLFGLPPECIVKQIEEQNISHVSCTPTFFKQLLPYIGHPIHSIRQLTFGGERFDQKIERKIKQFFPDANLRNVYASTEAGSLFATEGEYFKISSRLIDFVKVNEKSELLIHKDLLGKSASFELENEWYNTGDLVEFEKGGHLFKFLSRKSEMINVGGYKVNPSEVEAIISKVDGVEDVIVSGRKNSVTGKIVIAQVILMDSYDKTEVKKAILSVSKEKLQYWKVPQLVKFIDSFDITRTGKIVRNA